MVHLHSAVGHVIPSLCRECGCGNGDSGCSACGCCQVCGGEKESWGGLGDGFGFGGDLHLLRGVRGHPKDKKDKKKDKKKRVRKDKKEGEKKEDKEKGEMGLQLLFGSEFDTIAMCSVP